MWVARVARVDKTVERTLTLPLTAVAEPKPELLLLLLLPHATPASVAATLQTCVQADVARLAQLLGEHADIDALVTAQPRFLDAELGKRECKGWGWAGPGCTGLGWAGRLAPLRRST